jgi:hypothetical protein
MARDETMAMPALSVRELVRTMMKKPEAKKRRHPLFILPRMRLKSLD